MERRRRLSALIDTAFFVAHLYVPQSKKEKKGDYRHSSTRRV